MKVHSLKFQFAVYAASVAVLSLALAAAVLLPLLHSRQSAELDEQLADDARKLFEAVDKYRASALTGEDGVVARMIPVALRLRYFELEGPDGRTLHRSGNLGGLDVRGEPDKAQTLSIGGRKARMFTLRDGPFTLHVGTTMGRIENTQSDLRFGLLVTLPLVVLGAFGGGLLLGRRALRPVTALTAAAETISTDQPQDRLPVPPTGDEIARLSEVLNRSFDRLQRSYEMASRFSTDASHQLKTPVAILRTGLDALRRMDSLPDEARAEVETLLTQVRRLTALIEDLLLLAQADAGRLQLETAPLDLIPLAERALEDLEMLTAERDLTISHEWPESLPCRADRRRIALILQNLAENAAKFTPAGGRVRITARRESGMAVLTVANTGSPVPEEQRGAIFDRFHRGTAGGNVSGQGLGLNIARELARAHGGDLVLEPGDSEWTTFTLRLPAGA